MRASRARGVLVGLAAATAALAWAASLRQSATFDEIVLVAGGTRAVTQGEWGMISDQPPLPLLLYGSAVRGGGFVLPPEDRPWPFERRWDYARAFLFEMGNDPEAVLARARGVSAVLAGGLVAAAGGYAWWVAGPVAGVLATALTATLPDVLAHGGVAYNDIPLALLFVLSVWALDAAVRRPSVARGALAGTVVAATFGMKLSALALVPIAVLLVAAEAWARRAPRSDPGPEDAPDAHAEDGPEATTVPAWGRALAACVAVALLASYATFVVLYRGDVTLGLLRFNFWRTVAQTAGAFDTPAYLLGETRIGGWWYYFPLVFFLKTPAAFQGALLVVIGATVAGLARRGREGGGGPGVWTIARWRGRGAALGVLVFGAFLMRSDINGGFRYALPALGLLAILVAVGLARLWQAAPGWTTRGPVVALVALQALSVWSYHPHYLAYSSVWAGGRDQAWRAVSDSNIDWGQGLLELRAFMAREGVETVRLSYFGSARPEAYGIPHVPLPSFFRLDTPVPPSGLPSPRFTVISATNLVGLHLQGYDPFAAYRDRAPFAVLGHSMLVFDEGGP